MYDEYGGQRLCSVMSIGLTRTEMEATGGSLEPPVASTSFD